MKDEEPPLPAVTLKSSNCCLFKLPSRFYQNALFSFLFITSPRTSRTSNFVFFLLTHKADYPNRTFATCRFGINNICYDFGIRHSLVVTWKSPLQKSQQTLPVMHPKPAPMETSPTHLNMWLFSWVTEGLTSSKVCVQQHSDCPVLSPLPHSCPFLFSFSL